MPDTAIMDGVYAVIRVEHDAEVPTDHYQRKLFGVSYAESLEEAVEMANGALQAHVSDELGYVDEWEEFERTGDAGNVFGTAGMPAGTAPDAKGIGGISAWSWLHYAWNAFIHPLDPGRIPAGAKYAVICVEHLPENSLSHISGISYASNLEEAVRLANDALESRMTGGLGYGNGPGPLEETGEAKIPDGTAPDAVGVEGLMAWSDKGCDWTAFIHPLTADGKRS